MKIIIHAMGPVTFPQIGELTVALPVAMSCCVRARVRLWEPRPEGKGIFSKGGPLANWVYEGAALGQRCNSLRVCTHLNLNSPESFTHSQADLYRKKISSVSRRTLNLCILIDCPLITLNLILYWYVELIVKDYRCLFMLNSIIIWSLLPTGL